MLSTNGKYSIFVYGTLMEGFGNNAVIAPFPHTVWPAIIENVEMYNVGGFPALIKGNHRYYGELVVFDESVNVEDVQFVMDRLEGYRKGSPEKSMYLREKVNVQVDGDYVETEVYFWNRSVDTLEYIDPEKFNGYNQYHEYYVSKKWGF